MSKWRRRYEGAAMLLLTVVFGALAWAEADDLRWLRERGAVVPAVVLAKEGWKTERITVRYETLAGQTIVERTSNFLEADQGQTIDVVYDREDPHRMQSADYGTDYSGPIIFGVFAVLTLVIGIVLLKR
ncbi:DUF3592 domain-containing protein [Kribbella endophytica]